MLTVRFDPPTPNEYGGWHIVRIEFAAAPRVLRYTNNERIKTKEFYLSEEDRSRGWVEKRLFIDSFPGIEVVK